MEKDPQYFRANRGVMAGFLPDRYERVLEVGCGSGGFARFLHPACETWGVEPDAGAASAAAACLNRVLVGRYDDVAREIPDRHFDLVVCNDVIEHMPDHDGFLEAVKLKLRPGGYLVGSIPNVRHVTALYKLLVARDWPYSPSGILDRTHLRFFTEKSLLRTFHEHGYTVERCAGIGSIIAHGILGANRPGPVLNLAYRAVALTVVALSLGWYADTQYPQFGFRVRAPA